jgi:protein-tyrosine phosphatase
MIITFVCSQNKCRSPLCEAMAKKYLEIFEIKNTIILSHGIYYNLNENEKPCESSIEIAKEYNLDISNHKSKKLTTNEISMIDYIFVMDKSNYNDVCMEANEEDIKKVHYLDMNNENISDPWQGEKEIFENLILELEKNIELQFELIFKN